MRNLALWAVAAGLTCVGALVAPTAQAVVLSSTDFESFALGSVNGQGGWSVTGGYDQEVVNDGGNKAFRLSDAVTSGSFGDQTFAPRPGGTGMTSSNPTNSNPGFFAGQSSTGATYNRYLLGFDFKSATQQNQDGAFLSVSADNGQGGRQTYLGITANGTNLDLITYNVDTTGNFVGPISLGLVAGSVWSHVDFVLDFGNGLNDDIVTIALNGTPVHTGTSWEQYYVINQPLLHPLGVPVQTAIFMARATANPSHLGGGFLFDNVQVEATSTVPEPVSLALLGIGLTALGFSRRRRS